MLRNPRRRRCRRTPNFQARGVHQDFFSSLLELRLGFTLEILNRQAREGKSSSNTRRSHVQCTRVTAILNRNTHDISTDLMLRVLASLGVKAKLQFKSAA